MDAEVNEKENPMTRSARLLRYEQRFNELKAMLESIGFLSRGSVQTKRAVCGKATCRCHAEPANRHGPYHHWTRKLHGKTVGRLLGDQELRVYRGAIENSRKLEKTLRKMYEVSERALELVARKATKG